MNSYTPRHSLATLLTKSEQKEVYELKDFAMEINPAETVNIDFLELPPVIVPSDFKQERKQIRAAQCALEDSAPAER